MTFTEEVIVLMPKTYLNKSYQNLHCRTDFNYGNNTKVLFISGEPGDCSEKSLRTVIKPSYLNYQVEKSGTISISQIVYNGLELLNVKKIILFYDKNEFNNHINDNFQCIFTQLNIALSSNLHTGNVKAGNFLWLLSLLNILSKWTTAGWPILKYSAVGVQIKSTTERLRWAVSSLMNKEQEQLRIKAINFFISVIFDIGLGIFLMNSLLAVTSTKDFPRLFLLISENCVDYFRNLLQWLAGSPAGFKLNRNLNNILAQFFLFHTEIWWLFLVYISPVLSIAFHIFTFLGLLGMTIQAAILSDILALVSFHVYCIYAYAARLYNIQLSGLISLWRLFLGRKWNPLREKVDSCQYSTDELFVGTLAFTILLFLLPTTLIYYAVFITTRVVIVGIGGSLTRLQVYLHALPLYSALLWTSNSTAIRSSVQIQIIHQKCSNDIIAIDCRKVTEPFLSTMKNSIPDCIEVPTSIPAGMIHKILTGQLLYPV